MLYHRAHCTHVCACGCYYHSLRANTHVTCIYSTMEINLQS